MGGASSREKPAGRLERRAIPTPIADAYADDAVDEAADVEMGGTEKADG
jgi:hypothetical protein